MPVFAYKARDGQRRVIGGTLTADTPAEARRQLRTRGLQLAEFKPCKPSAPRWQIRLPSWSKRRRHDQVAEMARHLAILIRTGVPLAEALDVLVAQSSGRFQIVLRQAREQIAGGSTLADTLASHSQWFDDVFVSAVRVGEITGSLDDALSALADYLQERQSLYTKLTAALIYPFVLLVLGTGVVIFLMTFVMPQLLSVLTASGRSLPASTLALKKLSDLLVNHGGLIGLATVVALIGLSASLRVPRLQRRWHGLQLRLPLAGPLMAKAVIAQFAQMLVLLLKAGVPFVEAVAVVGRSVRNRILADELHTVRRAVEAGSDIAPALADSRVFPPLVVHVIGVGQETGELTTMLNELKLGYETEVRLAIAKFTAALEPLLIIVLAAGIGFVIFATLMPILEATRVMG